MKIEPKPSDREVLAGSVDSGRTEDAAALLEP